MAAAIDFALRPLSAERTSTEKISDPLEAYKIYLSMEGISKLDLERGGLYKLSTTDGRHGYAILWDHSDRKTNMRTMKLTDDLKERYSFKFEDRITLHRIEEDALRHATKVYVAEISVKSDSTMWSEYRKVQFECQNALLNTRYVIPGPLLKITIRNGTSSKSHQKKLFRIQNIETSESSNTNCPFSLFDYESHIELEENSDHPSGPETSSKPIDLDLIKIAGLQKQVEKLYHHLRKTLYEQPRREAVLFHGPSGTGKSLLLSQLSSAPWKQVVKIDQQVKNAASIHKIFESAIANQPSLVIIDRLDTIAPSGSRDAQNVNPLSVQLQEDLKGIQGKKILVVAATKALYHVDEELLRPDAFLWEIEFPVPGADARIEILRYIAKEQNLDIANDVSESIARRAHGFVGEDLLRLCEYAGYHAELRNEHKGGERKTNGETVPSMEQVDGSELLLQVTIEDLESALVKARPASIREIHVQKPNVRWTDVGGYDYIKKAMSNVLERPLKRPDVVASYKLEPDKGVLFYGPPGCSKTLCAKAIATESDYNFISVKGAELLSMYVGESERALRDVFYKARNASPSIIFFDEFDSIGASRNSSSQGSGLHVLTTLLTEMDGIVALKGVLVIAATNRPESLDQALLRRFINRIYVGPPDFRSRKEILGIRLKDLPLAEDVRLEELSEQTEGYSGAEIVDICSKAKNTTADRYTEKEEQNAPLELISRADFQNAIDSTAKVITPKMISFYEDWSTGSLTNR